MATWHVELTRKGPGLLLRDIQKDTAEVAAVVRGIAHIAPDVILLTGIDWDLNGVALAALTGKLSEAGVEFPHVFAGKPNSGQRLDLDMDGDGYLGGSGDAQGWGRFVGYGGMAVLSSVSIVDVRDFSTQLWKDQPGALLPVIDDKLFPSEAVFQVQRLSSVAFWDVQLRGGLHLLTMSTGPPVFDGPEDRNGRRNHDETMFWVQYLEELDGIALVLGNANLDPMDGDGLHVAIRALLAHPKLQDPQPRSDGGVHASRAQGGVNDKHLGDPGLDTADWSDEKGPGNLRVSYVLPDASLKVIDAGVLWPAPGDVLGDLLVDGPRHRLVWVDLEF